MMDVPVGPLVTIADCDLLISSHIIIVCTIYICLVLHHWVGEQHKAWKIQDY